MTHQECLAAQYRMQRGERVYVRHPELGCCLVRLIDEAYKNRGWVSFIFGRSGGWQCFADEVQLVEPSVHEEQLIAH